jgi:hypothetical protein
MGFGKYNTFYVFVVFFLISFSQHSFSQEKPDGLDVMLSPRITIGYTFGAGINCGLDLGCWCLQDKRYYDRRKF